MAIEKRKCKQCDAEFYGSSNAKYCSKKCKQKAWRNKDKEQ